MASTKTGIEWTDATWNPVTGCDKVSAGCDNCYALTQAARLKAMGSADYQTDGKPPTSGPGFGVAMHAHRLDQPLRWTKPKKVFVNSMSDLWHPRVTEEHIAKVFAVMTLSPQHTFQVLTKRPKRMRAMLSRVGFRQQVRDLVLGAGGEAGWLIPGQCVICRHATTRHGQNGCRSTGCDCGSASWHVPASRTLWPLPNVWLGVSVEDQRRADERIPELANTPAAVRFLSCEPLLGAVTLPSLCACGCGCGETVAQAKGEGSDPGWLPRDLAEAAVGANLGVDWVIVGGESGHGARPMHPAWVTGLRDQCVAAGVPFLFKQWGEWSPVPEATEHRRETDSVVRRDGVVYPITQAGPWCGTDDATVRRVGKHAAGRTLDGRTWDQYPTPVSDACAVL